MKKFYLAAVIMAMLIGASGCRRAAPTVFIWAVSEYFLSYSGSTQSYHSAEIKGAHPDYQDTITMNNSVLQSSGSYGGGWFFSDTLPKISPGDEIEMKATYYNLNADRKEASAKVKIPNKPNGVDVSVNQNDVIVSWTKPDGTTKFVVVSLTLSCVNGSGSTDYGSFDTTLFSLETTSVTANVNSLCNLSNIVYISAYATVSNLYGPGPGDKDNVKGAAGQFYGSSAVSDTASWSSFLSRSKYTLSPAPEISPQELSKRLRKALEKALKE